MNLTEIRQQIVQRMWRNFARKLQSLPDLLPILLWIKNIHQPRPTDIRIVADVVRKFLPVLRRRGIALDLADNGKGYGAVIDDGGVDARVQRAGASGCGGHGPDVRA